MSKSRPYRMSLLSAVTICLVLPTAAEAGSRHADCFDRVFRGVDSTMTRIVHHTDRALTDMFRWCDRRR